MFNAGSLARTAAVCLTLFVAAAPAQSAVYRGIFDPAYGAPFPTLSWGGSLSVTVADACVQPGTVTLLTCFGGLQITEASIDVFDTATNTTQTMNFGDAAGPGLLGLNWGLEFDVNSQLVGANSTAFPVIQGDLNGTKFGNRQAWFSLQFLGDYAQLYWFEEKPSALELLYLTAGIGDLGGLCRDNGVKRVWFGFDDNRCGWSATDGSGGSFIEFTQVSEPATFALVPAALGLMGLVAVRSRRRQARSAT